MNVQTLHKKLELIQWLSTLEDNSIIEKLIKFKKEESEDLWLAVSDVEKESIEKGISDAENKNITPHSSARKLYEKWL